ncbi:hypothetical protein OSB04_031564 [Centaurea solstitialis]|uniref:Uncharacterized protein n=1 Tax=Centaurea solstitialis TaxID=347529 RepID=A0AA38SMV6_9ASTR|nr:hypothetical protein OSB04_031564 [Centaurea solstitialis]
MASDSDGGGGINFSPLVRTLAKGAAVTLGGIFSITIISSTAISLLHKRGEIGSSSSMKKKNGSSSSCDVCREKGFYICKLCNGNGTIEWSPLYDPLFINPCLCPTCDGHRSVAGERIAKVFYVFKGYNFTWIVQWFNKLIPFS